MHPMDYRKPTEQEVYDMETIALHLKIAYDVIMDLVPDGPRKEQALNDALDARMHSNQGIIIDSTEYVE